MLLISSGSYLLWRTVHREIAVARMQTDFVAAVSHEFRTPLTSLEPDGPKAAGDAYPGFADRFHRAYLAEMAVFTQVVAGTVANPSPARESLISLRLAEACERSRRSGAPVRVETEVVA